jgi:GT2 family glycosyltransferase
LSSSLASYPKISVVIPVLNEAEYLRRTVEQFQATMPPGSEIIVVDDGSTDGGTDFLNAAQNGIKLLKSERLGVAGARNRGAEEVAGDIIVFSDAHVETPPDWWVAIVEALANPNVGVVAPAISNIGSPQVRGFGMCFKGSDLSVEWLGQLGSTSYAVPLLCGCFLAMRRDVFETTRGFDNRMIRYGSEDLELSLRLWLLGYEARVIPQVTVAHLFREKHPYEVEWKACVHNILRMAFAHFSSDRLTRVIEVLKGYPDFPAALASMLDGDIWNQRAGLAARRVRTDDWFFNSFGMVC